MCRSSTNQAVLEKTGGPNNITHSYRQTWDNTDMQPTSSVNMQSFFVCFRIVYITENKKESTLKNDNKSKMDLVLIRDSERQSITVIEVCSIEYKVLYPHGLSKVTQRLVPQCKHSPLATRAQAAGDRANTCCSYCDSNTAHPAPGSPLPYLFSLDSSCTQKVEDIYKKAIIASWKDTW